MTEEIAPSYDETEEREDYFAESLADEGRTVSVTQIGPHGSMYICKGIDDDGHLVTFAAEYRYGFEIAEALDANEDADVVAFVPDHMILSHPRDRLRVARSTVSGPAFEIRP